MTNARPDLGALPLATQAAGGPPAVECSAIGRSYGSVVAVSDISLSIEQGEFFALLGPNGAGKTTLLHMLTTLVLPTSGSARVMGYDVVRDAAAVRRTLGMVFQDPAVDERLTARENLEIHAVLYGIRRPDRRSAVDDALEWASLTEVGSRKVRSFSGGMKRRLELARALMHAPKVLFLDEPTIGLDPQGRRHLWEHITALREAGLTVLMTTHNLPEAEACDRVGIIDNGTLVTIGAPADLIATHAATPSAGEASADLEDVFIALTGKRLRDEVATARDRLVSFAKRGGEHTR